MGKCSGIPRGTKEKRERLDRVGELKEGNREVQRALSFPRNGWIPRHQTSVDRLCKAPKSSRKEVLVLEGQHLLHDLPRSEEVPHVQLKTIDLPADQSLAELLPVEAQLQGGMVATSSRVVRTS